MKIKTKAINSKAIFSDCKNYRYVLERTFTSGKGSVNFILLNPSTADEFHNDPTIAKCEKWCIDNNIKTMYITNVFAFRATEPKDMLQSKDPIGQYNEGYLLHVANISDIIICGWGNHATHFNRHKELLKLLAHFTLRCFKINKNGSPCHPLYIPMKELSKYNG